MSPTYIVVVLVADKVMHAIAAYSQEDADQIVEKLKSLGISAQAIGIDYSSSENLV
jgi:hypothetical protein